MRKTGAILLAAGEPSNNKIFKPMLPFRDSTIVRQMVFRLKKMKIEPIAVVTGYRGDELEEHLWDLDIYLVRNVNYREGQMLDSIVSGIKRIGDDCQRIVIMPMDIPAIKEETFLQILRRDEELIRTSWNGHPGHPVVINRRFAKTLCNYAGEGGLQGAMESSGYPIVDVKVQDEGVCREINTQESYEELLEWNYQRGEGYPVCSEVQVRLWGNEVFFDQMCCMLLEKIEETGSIMEACSCIGISYSKGTKLVRQIDKELGFSVVERKSGGNGGGCSHLTESGKKLVDSYKKMISEVQESTDKIYRKYFARGFHV